MTQNNKIKHTTYISLQFTELLRICLSCLNGINSINFLILDVLHKNCSSSA